MSGRPGSANNGASCNACDNANDVGASNRGRSAPPLDIDALFVVVIVVVVDANADANADADTDEGPPFISGPNPAGLFGRLETHDVSAPPGYASTILSPPVLVRDPSKSRATAAISIAAAINKLDIEVKEANKNDASGGVNFMVYAGAVFGGLLLVGGVTVLFMDSMTNTERRRAAKWGE